MPVRNEAEKAKTPATPAKGGAAPAAKRAAAKKPEAAPAKEAAPAAGAKVQKSPLEEKVKKYLAEVNKEFPNHINEIFERAITSKEDNEKTNCVFVAFSPKGAEDEAVDDDFNIGVMKDVLFHYHTAPEKKTTATKAMMVEVVSPKTEDDVHVMCFQEINL